MENDAKLGGDTIEVCAFKLDDKRAAAQLALVGRHGLEGSAGLDQVWREAFAAPSCRCEAAYFLHVI